MLESVQRSFPLPWSTVPRSALGAITLIILMPAPPTASTGLTGSWADSSSAPDRGMAGAGVAAAGGMAATVTGAATAIAAAMLDVAVMLGAAAILAVQVMAAGHEASRRLPEAALAPAPELAAADMPAADSMVAAVVVVASTAVVAAAMVAAVTGKTCCWFSKRRLVCFGRRAFFLLCAAHRFTETTCLCSCEDGLCKLLILCLLIDTSQLHGFCVFVGP